MINITKVHEFIKYRKISFIISGTALAIGIIWMVLFGFTPGIEFSGGISTKINITMEPSEGEELGRVVNPEEIREIMKSYLEDKNFQEGSVIVAKLPSGRGENRFQIKLKTEMYKAAEEKAEAQNNPNTAETEKESEDAKKVDPKTFVEKEVVQRIRNYYTEKNEPIKSLTVMERVFFSSEFGADLGIYAFWFVLLIIGLIILYITFRFQFKFGIAAVIALIHDTLLVLGIAAIIGREVTVPLIVAILTLLGYSLNDTIVVFDRIRENSRDIKDKDYIFIINKSISQSLNRTIITSITTELAAIPLFVVSLAFQVDVLFDIAFFLFIGIMIGTYSSIFIASPTLYLWENWWTGRKELKKQRQAASRRRASPAKA